jgi:NAD(P)-dependent dehydrogenase (short-subunit alcohol dehydrogenase family)
VTVAGRVALVVGAAGGIGRAVVDRLEREGATVVAADLAGSPHAVDVTSEDAVVALMATVEREAGRLDVLVNAAGVELEKTVEDTSLAEWEHSFAVNVTGVSASIVNFGSYDGFVADPGLAAYCATKGAVHALTRAMACDHGPEGIRVNAVCPGYVDTPMLQSFFDGAGSGGAGRSIGELQEAVRGVHPLRRYGTPDDVANLVHWLASDEARYASGQLWVLDGGLTAQVQQMRL